jgi:subtilisin family serine protease
MRSTSMLFLITLLGVTCLHDLVAQTPSIIGNTSAYQPTTNASPGVVTSIVTKGDSVLERRTFDPNEEVQVIVQFHSPPLSSVHNVQGTFPALGAAALSTTQSQIESDHTRFHADLLRLEGSVQTAPSARSALKGGTGRVSAEYRKVLNGVALRSRRWLIDRLRTLPYVKSISHDRQVHALDAASNHQIGADSVWAKYGVTGAGVRIGVIDTGIDYMHPDLGGGFGAGHKVAGGWDFVNNDADPSDDNGHGTHVAGIAASDGLALKGVAPKATLYAVKVLNAEGKGFSSWIISGLEWAVDPDGNPATEDHLDIVNLSFGGSGDPTDPMSQAIDYATAAGVLCVVAAGNNGSYQSIESPGCAAGALTVGACNAFDDLAAFSSRGPTRYSFSIKPDLVAPGVDILSTVLNGSYGTKSGTSMATPHAAGAAALLKQLHPEWAPEMLKGVLVQTAKDLGQGLWSQGKGRLDLAKAVSRNAMTSPQTLSFGLDNLTTPSWIHTDTISLYNNSDSAMSFGVAPFTDLPAGVSLTAEATAVTVPAHGRGQLVFTLEVNNNVAQIPQESPRDITGTITLVCPQNTLQIPWAAIMGSYVELEVAVPENSTPGDARFTPLSGGTSLVFDNFAWTGSTWRLKELLPIGSYEVVLRVLGWSKIGVAWLVRDSVTINPVANLLMSDAEALYRVGTALKDENGRVLDSTYCLSWCTRLYSKKTGVGVQMGVSGPTEPISTLDRVSPLSANYVFDYYYTTDFGKPKAYTYAGQVSPVLSDQVTDIKAGDLVGRSIEYRVHSDIPALKLLQTVSFNGGWLIYAGSATTPALSLPFQQVWYAQKQPPNNFPWNGAFINHQFLFDSRVDSLFDPSISQAIFLLPNQAPGTDGVLRSSVYTTMTPVQESRGKRLIYGLGPKHYFGRMDNRVPTKLQVQTNTQKGTLIPFFFPRESVLPLFSNQAMDAQSVGPWLRLQDSAGHVIAQSEALYPNHLDLANGVLTAALPGAGRFTLQLRDAASYVLSLKGAAIVDLTVDTRLSDRNPPAMTSFNIFGADSEYTDMLLPGESGRVEFRVSDAETGLHTVSLFYHTDSARAWVNVPLTNQGDLYRGQLPAFALKDGLVSLRVLATDAAGNSMDYRAEPALHIGSDFTYANRPPEKVQLLTPAPGGMLQLYDSGHPTVFSWQPAVEYDGWDTVSYTFRIRGSGLGTSYDRWLRDTTVTLWLIDIIQPDETYQWWVETADGHVLVASDTATFRTSSTILSVPGAERDLPKQFSLAQNYPNPFNPTTTIGYDLPRESRVVLKVFNLLGQEVMTLADREETAGRYHVTLDGRHLASGVYIYRLRAVSSANSGGNGEGSFTAARKFLVVH